MEFSPVMTSFVHHPVSSVFMTPETPTSHRSLMNGFQRVRQGTYTPNLFCTPSPVSLSPVSHGIPQYTNFQYPLYFAFNRTPTSCDKTYLSTSSPSPNFTDNIPKRDVMTPPPTLTAELPFDDSMDYSDDEDDFGPPPLLAGYSCPPKTCKPLKFSVDYLLS